MDILIIKPKWVNLIFDGCKTWEIRGSNIKKRGKIGIAASKTSKVFGTVNLTDCISLTKEIWEENKEKHMVDIPWEELIKRYKKPYAWVMQDKHPYAEPVQYHHPKGAVIWVKDKNIKEEW